MSVSVRSDDGSVETMEWCVGRSIETRREMVCTAQSSQKSSQNEDEGIDKEEKGSWIKMTFCKDMS